jgi:transposase
MTYVGIDVSKATLEVAIHGQPAVRSFANTSRGWAKLVRWLTPQCPGKIVLEATGGYEQGVLDTLHTAGWPVARVNPRQARDFAKGCGQLAKTDVLDARVLAHLAQVVDVPCYGPPSAAQRAIRAHHWRRDQLRAMLQAETQHARQETDAACCRDIRQHMAQLRRRLAQLEQALRTQVQACPQR